MGRQEKKGNETGYRVVGVDTGVVRIESVLSVIQTVNRGLSRRDGYLSSDDKSLFIHINRLDYSAFRDLVRKAVASFIEGKEIGLDDTTSRDRDPQSGGDPCQPAEAEESKGIQLLFEDLLRQVDSIRSYGMKAGKRVYYDYTAERKVQNRKVKVQRRKALFYTSGNTFSRDDNPLPREYTNAIVCGDSREVLSRLPNNSIDLILTSPPYNFGIGYDTGEDGIDWEEYLSRLYSVLDECVRVLRWGGRIVVNVQPLFSDYLPLHHLVSQHLMSSHLIWKGEILWEKNNYNCKYTAWGSWKSPKSPYLKYTWEFLEVFAKGDLSKDGRREDIDLSADEFKSWVVARWSLGPERAMKSWGHPAMFPEALAERVIKLFSYKGDVILDPFNGAGTTTAVASRLNRRYLGIDISADYCATARSRTRGDNRTLDEYSQ